MPHAYGHEPDESSLQHGLKAELVFELEISRIITAANLTFGQIGLQNKHTRVSSDTKATINIFMSQLSRAEARCVGQYGQYTTRIYDHY